MASNRPTNPLIVLSSAAVMTIYAAGYLRTQPAAAKLQASERDRIVIPVNAPDNHGSAAAVAGSRDAPSVSLAPASARVPEVRKTARPASKVERAGRPAAAARQETAQAATSNGVASFAPAGTATAEPPATPPPAPPVPAPAPAPVAPQYKDGTYTGWGTSRHGDIQATVVIESGRIASAVISQCLTRYSCSWVAHLQGQVAARQSPEVDYVSGATQSTNAFYYAVVEALSKAK